jgi:hypothetical protein
LGLYWGCIGAVLGLYWGELYWGCSVFLPMKRSVSNNRPRDARSSAGPMGRCSDPPPTAAASLAGTASSSGAPPRRCCPPARTHSADRVKRASRDTRRRQDQEHARRVERDLVAVHGGGHLMVVVGEILCHGHFLRLVRLASSGCNLRLQRRIATDMHGTTKSGQVVGTWDTPSRYFQTSPLISCGTPCVVR